MRASLLAAALGLAATGAAADPRLEPCLEQVLETPRGRAAAECFVEVVRAEPDAAAAAVRALDELIARDPQAGWLYLYRGNLLWPNSGGNYVDAARLFSEQGDVAGEIRARVNQLTKLGRLDGDFAGMAAELERARAALAKGAAPEDRASVLLADARYLMVIAGDQATALRRLQEAWAALSEIEQPEYSLVRECLRALHAVSLDLGLYRDANHYAVRARELARANDALRDEASAAYDEVLTEMETTPPDPRSRERALAKMRQVLDLASTAGDPYIEAQAHRRIAAMAPGPGARAHTERCLDGAREVQDRDLERECLLTRANLSLAEDPEAAWSLVNQAYGLGRQQPGPWTLIIGWRDYLSVLWETRPRDEAAAAGEAVLDAIEALRRAQVGDGRDRLLSAYSHAYYWLAGRLLGSDVAGDGPRRAFQILERLRAQTLREYLAGHRKEPLHEEDGAILEQIRQDQSRAYRGLLDPSLEPGHRQRFLAELEALEQAEAELWTRQRATGAPSQAAVPAPPRDLLDRVEAALDADEALLSFQLGSLTGYDGRPSGGAWVLATTRAGTRAFPLGGDRAAQEPAIRAFLDQGEPDNRLATRRLYHDLLAPALAELPPGIRRLTLVPDGQLHLLPFAALGDGGEAPLLVEQFELTTAPSAAVWLGWRQHDRPEREGSVAALVLADPATPATLGEAARRGWELAEDPRLGRLAHARREGRRVVRHLRGASRMVAGEGASEAFVKSTDLARFDILHFAAHAVVDDARPGRSAVLLAPGADTEDGLLRAEEIHGLRGLEGKLIVLSSCNSAAGAVLRGEGVMSLARAFFVAGADTVIGSLWPLDDRGAMEFFDDLYGFLGTGLSVSEAVAATQRLWIRTGRPASTWAGIVALGNGDVIPAAGGVERPPGWTTLLLVAAALTLLTALYLLARRRARRR